MVRREPPIGIAGGGIGGLSAAIRLAAAGEQVILFEKNPAVGGKMSELCADSFRWDTGPSVITMRHVLDDLFACAGLHLEDYLELTPVDPLTRYFFADGTVFDVEANWPRLAANIAQLDERDVAGYLNFVSHAAELHRITGPVFIYNQPPSLASILRVPPRDMLRVAPWQTIQQLIDKHVNSPHLRQLLGRFATYVGASPYAAPSTLSVIAHVELTGGVWYPRGGIYRIAQALAKVAQDLGVEIYTDTAVERIQVSNGRVRGVVLSNGNAVPLSALIANLDVVTVYTRLLPQEDRRFSRRATALQQRDTSCSGFALLLGLEGEHPELTHHNIFFSRDYRREFTEIFDEKIPPTDPTVYVAITSKSDAEHAPPGHENWFVLVNAPALSPHFDWTTQADAYTDRVLNTLAGHGYPIRNTIRTQIRMTPADLAARTGAWRGALYGISSNHALNALRRPHNRAPDVAGLYFAGGTTHPGGGVPMVVLSGKVAAQLALDDLR